MSEENPLVSIIIPTYNRAHLIGETLDSVLAQTYQNWECIVVDDGSTDNTDEVMAGYIAKDSRFRYYHRPADRLPGGNAARNYGFEMSKGEYVQWFDSDDLMVYNKIEIKVKAVLINGVDFVISKTKYFNREDYLGYLYPYESSDINFINYVMAGINWYTPDMFLNRNIAEKIHFNENLKSGQETNFSYKLLMEANSSIKINKVLTMRRHHEESIGFKRRQNPKDLIETTFESLWVSLKELRSSYILPDAAQKYLFLRCCLLYFQHKEIRTDREFHKVLWELLKLRAVYFYLASSTNLLSGRYFYFYSKMKK